MKQTHVLRAKIHSVLFVFQSLKDETLLVFSILGPRPAGAAARVGGARGLRLHVLEDLAVEAARDGGGHGRPQRLGVRGILAQLGGLREAIQKGTRVLISLWDSLMFGRVPKKRRGVLEYPPEH